VGLVVALAACGSDNTIVDEFASTTTTTAVPVMTVTSPEFADGGAIPTEFTCAGAGDMPRLTWSAAPAGTEELAVLVFDPDAGTNGFVHYLGWGIDPTRTGTTRVRYFGAQPGMNGRGSEGWVPPCPPSGGPHHYEFNVFALSKTPEIAPTANVAQFLDGIKGLVVAQGKLTGLYGR
jgi:Raf kinase inhibitor-like YbhB/YbcL family protein